VFPLKLGDFLFDFLEDLLANVGSFDQLCGHVPFSFPVKCRPGAPAELCLRKKIQGILKAVSTISEDFQTLYWAFAGGLRFQEKASPLEP
jgi:hypothetical protein